MVHRRHGEVGAAHGAAVHPQAVEGLGRRDLVDEVEVDVEEVGLAVGAADDVALPHLLGQRLGHPAILAGCRPRRTRTVPPFSARSSRCHGPQRAENPGVCDVRPVRAGIDTGGTFTDLVDDSGRVVKVSSTPDDPARAVRDALDAAGVDNLDLLAHGTTVATNALIQRTGGRVALVTTRGFADIIEIARQVRPSLYDQHADRPAPLVPRAWRFEVGGRLDVRGGELEPLEVADVPPIPPEVDAVAVVLLHADLDPRHEQVVAEHLRQQGLDVTCSHEVSPEIREYERTVTTVANATLRTVCRDYLHALSALAAEALVMTSAGGLLPAEAAAELPAALLLSGPAGGVRAAAAVATACGFPDAVTFDMGGTSTDVCLVRGGVPEPAPERVVAGFPIRLPALDVHTIGAGGGSIARVDRGGALVVGPQSAGAAPGPACYGRGGDAPTVTDADLALGRIDPDATFPDLGRLDVRAAHDALARAGTDAGGVVAVVDAAMERAVRVVTVERGVDPARPRARRVRWRRPLARVRHRGGARHARGHRPAPCGGTVRGRPARVSAPA